VTGRRKKYGRARTLWTTLAATALGTVLPGSGIYLTGRRRLGAGVLLTTATVVGLGVYLAAQRSTVLSAAVDPDKLLAAALVAIAVVLALTTCVVVTYWMVRRPTAPSWERAVEAVFVVLLCLAVAAPFALGSRYAFVQRDLVKSVFSERSAGVVAEHEDDEDDAAVWGEDHRVNVLLLGGDGGVTRVGIRTDSMIVASLDADTGDGVLFGLPRNLQRVPFPEGSELDRVYPRGFTGPGDPLEWMLNAVYGTVPEQHPGLLDAENEGAEAVKQAASGALGIPVDYYVLVNLRGFKQMVDAIGGVTVNINQPIPIGGVQDRGVPPRDYLDPGPNQHLDGFEALWFARGRYGLDDYDRMERQRCVLQAFVEEADPFTVLRRYESLASAGKEILRTDIPQDLLPAFVELGMRLKDGDLHSVVFQRSDRFDPNDPNYRIMRRTVQNALERISQPEEAQTAEPVGNAGDGAADGERAAASRRPGSARSAQESEPAPVEPSEPRDPCAYRPVR
jgi:LCP family protein required for cell wall assembly